MDPQKLVYQGTDKPVALACSKCGLVYRLNDEELADQCCRPLKCECGADVEKHYTACSKCMAERDKKREKEAFDRAEKIYIDDYKGEHVVDGIFSDDEFVPVDEIEDRIEEKILDGVKFDTDMPIYAYAVEEVGMPQMDARDVVDGYLQDFYEEAIEQVDLKGLQELLDKWVDEQTLTSWFQDDSKVVLLGSIYEKVKKEIEIDRMDNDEANEKDQKEN